jgi:hypothetical protein
MYLWHFGSLLIYYQLMKKHQGYGFYSDELIYDIRNLIFLKYFNWILWKRMCVYLKILAIFLFQLQFLGYIFFGF